jgi:hypothetical protein
MTAIRDEATVAGGDLLAEFDALHLAERQAQARIVTTAVEFALANGPATVDAAQAQLPGWQRAVWLGGQGTPKVAEFAPALIGARLQLSPYAAARLVADGLDLYYRLPLLWQRLQALEVKTAYARFVARRTRELSVEQAASVDAAVAELADGRLSWSRFVDAVEAAIIAADPAGARAREEQAAQACFARTSQTNQHGMRGFYLRADFATIARIEATVAYLAQMLADYGCTETEDRRRVLAVLLMANPVQAARMLAGYRAWRSRHNHSTAGREPESEAGRAEQAGPAGEPGLTPEWFDPADTAAPATDGDADHAGDAGESALGDFDLAKLLPTVVLYVHLAASTLANDCHGVARVEGEPPISAAWVRDRLGPRCRFRITPVLDPLHQTPADAWEIPNRHRDAVHLLTPADVFPHASNRTRRMQIDHTDPYVHRGPPEQSRIGNYGPMTGFHHRLKTHGGWAVKQPYPGIYLWRDPSGAIYLVDNTGTRRLGDT